MAFAATSPMVVDLSGDNDNAGAIAAAATIPSTSPDTPFENSCDNSECSAPKLISLVPKRETPEFITEPVIMNQPTLINGFTTVFQIDGISAEINNIMHGDQSNSTSPSTSNGIGTPLKPKSVFRIVPNTHAHIVNYVVVDGAGETMRKIKSNNADTMRKLLDSQRLSAEQMLKKIIGKAFNSPSRQIEQPFPQPISSKVAVFSTPAPVPVPRSVLPIVPRGITITPIPTPDKLQIRKPTSSLSTTPSQIPNTNVVAPKLPTSPPSTSTTAGASILRQALVTAPEDTTQKPVRQNILKRKLVSAPIADMTKKLRPRSPKQKTPLASGLLPLSIASPPQPKKLPTFPKLQTTEPPSGAILLAHSTVRPKKIADVVSFPKATMNLPPPECEFIGECYDSTTKDILSFSSQKTIISKPDANSTPLTNANVLPTEKTALESSSTKETLLTATTKTATSSNLKCIESLPVKSKPRMGPASKMKAMESAVSAQIPTTEVQSAAVIPKPSITKAGETAINSSSSIPSQVNATTMLKTKPCSVAIPKADIYLSMAIREKPVNTPKPVPSTISNPTIKVTTGLTTKQDTTSTSQKSTTAPNSKAHSQLAYKAGLTTNVTQIGNITLESDPSKDLLAFDDTKLNAILITTANKTDEALSAKATSKTDDQLSVIDPTPKSDTSDLKSNTSLLKNTTSSISKVEIPSIKVTRSSTPKTAATNEKTKPEGTPITRSYISLTGKPAASKPNAASMPKVDETFNARVTSKSLPTKAIPSTPKMDATTIAATVGRKESSVCKVTRSLTPKSSTPTMKSAGISPKISQTTASALTPSRSLRVVLSTLKSGIMTLPLRSSHPNLKISSVISGGTAVAAATLGTDSKPKTEKSASDESSGPDIEKLQKELFDLRRTVARLSKK